MPLPYKTVWRYQTEKRQFMKVIDKTKQSTNNNNKY